MRTGTPNTREEQRSPVHDEASPTGRFPTVPTVVSCLPRRGVPLETPRQLPVSNKTKITESFGIINSETTGTWNFESHGEEGINSVLVRPLQCKALEQHCNWYR